MLYLKNKNKKKFTKFDLVRKIMTYFLLFSFVILFIADISEASKIAWIRSHNWRWVTLDWLNYWSCWALQFTGVSSIILIVINIKIDKNKISDKNLILATNLKVCSMTYLLISSVLYTISMLLKLNTNEAKSFDSITEHQLVPFLFLIYLILDFYRVKFASNFNFYFRKLILFIFLMFIYPAFFILFELINGVATPNSYFGYVQFNFVKFGWSYVWKNIFISFGIFLGTSLIVFSICVTNLKIIFEKIKVTDYKNWIFKKFTKNKEENKI